MLYVSSAVADWAKLVEAMGCFAEGEGGAGDAGPGDAPADGGFFCSVCAFEPPHCDMNDRTVRGRTGRNISECFSKSDTADMLGRRRSTKMDALFTSLWTTHGSYERLLSGTNGKYFLLVIPGAGRCWY